jgi:hypothetical protein
MWCTQCGKQIPDTNRFCEFCGAKMEPVAATASVEPVVEPIVEPVIEPVVEPIVEPVVEEAPVVETPVYVAPVYEAPAEPERVVNVRMVDQRPRIQLPTCRGLGKMFFLSILTLGIYPIVIYSRIVTELNIAASRYDGERTMSFFGMLMVAPLTLMIYPYVWIHGLCRRIGAELQRRGLNYRFSAATFWLWCILGSLIIVGPFVFTHKLMKSMNKINADFNERG